MVTIKKGGSTMGRYKEENTTNWLDLLLSNVHSSKITDRQTGEKGEGAGFTRQEAKNNAWKSLKSKNGDC